MREKPLVGWLVFVALSLILLSCAAAPPTAPAPPLASAPRDARSAAPVSPPSPSSPAAARPTPVPTEPSPGSLAYLDFKNGFRDLKFGDSPTNDMALKEEAGDSKYYFRPRDDLTIGGAHMDRLVYGFYKNRLDSVLINTKGVSNSRALLDVLRQAYGYGAQPNRFMERYLWQGAQVIVSYDENSLTRDASVWFFSIPLRDERRANKERKAKQGVSGL